MTPSFDEMELLEVCRLPGEPVGMQLAIDRCLDVGGYIRQVHVVSVTPGGPADRAQPSSAGSSTSFGLQCGDEIVEINGKNLRLVKSNDEVMSLIDEMPLRLLLLVKRGASSRDIVQSPSDPRQPRKTFTASPNSVPRAPRPLQQQQQQQQQQLQRQPSGTTVPSSSFVKQTCTSSILHEGFEVRQLGFRKGAGERLGLRLEPITLGHHSYYQVSSNSEV
jgi:hypothetical protein